MGQQEENQGKKIFDCCNLLVRTPCSSQFVEDVAPWGDRSTRGVTAIRGLQVSSASAHTSCADQLLHGATSTIPVAYIFRSSTLPGDTIQRI
jgi:hypothetical protein